MTRPTHLIDMLQDEWDSIDTLLGTLDESQWKTMTQCPGWTVQDTLAHLVSSELGLHGEAPTTHRATDLSNVKNPIGEFNEHEIDARRGNSGAQVFAEWQAIQTKRRNSFATASDDYYAREMMLPTGPGTFADFLHIRVMDAWVHEQDIRRALRIPGNEASSPAAHSIGRFARSLPMVVGKRGKAPDASTVCITLSGPVRQTFHIATNNGKAAHVDSAESPICTITLDSNTYVALCCGREFWQPGDPRVVFSGDTELGARIMANFNVMI